MILTQFKTKNNIIALSGLKRCLVIIALITTFNPAKALISNYTFASSSGTYNAITGTTLFTSPWDDQLSSLLTIPFAFTYNNVVYNTLGVSANGFITMGSVPSSGTIYCGLQAAPPNSIAGYGTDLISASGTSTVRYATTGISPNRKFIIQYSQVSHYNSTGGDSWTFQIILNETSNNVDVVWGSSSDATTMDINNCLDVNTESGNVGLLGNTPADFNIRSVTNGVNNWSTSVAGTLLTDVCNISPTNIPASGLTYTWTPGPILPMTFSSCTTTFVNNTNSVAKNSPNNPVLQIQIVTTGTSSPIQVTSLDLTTAGCTNAGMDLSNARVYFTGFSDAFSTATQFGPIVPGPNGAYTVTDTASLTEGNNYFWVAYDIGGTAIVGDTVSGCCTQVTGNGTMGTQIPTVTCPAGWQNIGEIGFWTPIASLPPDTNAGVMLVLSDGTVIVKNSHGGGDGIGNGWNKLTPDIHGSYVNGTWSTIAPMFNTRLYFSSQILKDGRVYVAGGEYGTGGSQGETYNPLTNTWTMCPNVGHTVSDANSEILENGNVIQALVEGNVRGTLIYHPVTNTYTPGPMCQGGHNESAWVKLADGSILFVDIGTTNSERYIPSSNQWVVDATVPVDLYDPFGFETGGALLLPDGRAFFIGSLGHTAYYTPSGTSSPGIWTAGPDVPNTQGTPDAAIAMMVNGKLLCAVSPVPTSANHFPPPTAFYEFDYLSNSFIHVNAPTGAPDMNIPCYFTNMVALPDGTVLYGEQGSPQYYVYTPSSAPLAAGKPTISTIIANTCTTYTITGTLFNGISEGACYGDDWQMETNFPLVRLTSDSNVYYARTNDWNSTGVQRGTQADTTHFTLPAGLPYGSYSLVVVANGISSDPVPFSFNAPTLSSTLTPPDICSNTAFTYIPTSPDTNATFTWTRPAVAGISNAAVIIPQITNPNEVLINTTLNPVSVVYNYTVSYNGCSNNYQVTVVVNASVSIGGGPSFCVGDSLTLTAFGATSFLWSTGETTNSITVSPSIATSYSVTATNVTGCADTASIMVTINPLPVPVITASGPTTFCEGNSVTLYAGTYTSYNWNNGATSDSITVDTAGIYTVTITDANSCRGTDSITVSINPLPTVSFIGLPDTVCTIGAILTLTGSPSGGTFSGAGITGNTFDPSAVSVGTHTVTYSFTDSLGCENSYNKNTVVFVCVGIATVQNKSASMSVYPNPAHELLTVSFSTKGDGDYVITLSDMPGKIIKKINGRATEGNNSKIVNLAGIAKGTYQLTLRKGDDLFKTRIVLE